MIEQALRHELRRTVAGEWAHMEELIRKALDADSPTEQTVALLAAADWAEEMANEYDMGDAESD